MDRVVLLALLGIPIMAAIHAAGVICSTADQAVPRLHWDARWQVPQQTIPTYFVVDKTVERRA
jgi:hypothetical protein